MIKGNFKFKMIRELNRRIDLLKRRGCLQCDDEKIKEYKRHRMKLKRELRIEFDYTTEEIDEILNK